MLAPPGGGLLGHGTGTGGIADGQLKFVISLFNVTVAVALVYDGRFTGPYHMPLFAAESKEIAAYTASETPKRAKREKKSIYRNCFDCII